MQVNIWSCVRTFGNKKDNTGTFDFCSINIEDAFSPVDKSNYHKEGKGVLLTEIPVSKAVYDKLVKLDFPLKVELITEGKLLSGRLRTSIIDFKVTK